MYLVVMVEHICHMILYIVCIKIFKRSDCIIWIHSIYNMQMSGWNLMQVIGASQSTNRATCISLFPSHKPSQLRAVKGFYLIVCRLGIEDFRHLGGLPLSIFLTLLLCFQLAQ